MKLFQFDIRHRRMKSSLSFHKTIELAQSTRMAVKLTALTVLLILCYSNVSSYFYVDSVSIPHGCANSCPPQRDPSRFICARNRSSGQLGMFDGECFFGRFNHCTHIRSAQSKLHFAIFRIFFKRFLCLQDTTLFITDTALLATYNVT